jgi:hypothetical protein
MCWNKRFQYKPFGGPIQLQSNALWERTSIDAIKYEIDCNSFFEWLTKQSEFASFCRWAITPGTTCHKPLTYEEYNDSVYKIKESCAADKKNDQSLF